MRLVELGTVFVTKACAALLDYSPGDTKSRNAKGEWFLNLGVRKKANANRPEKLEVSPFGVKPNREKMGRICLNS